ncbi:MAG: ABC transporter ATP-binding protein [Clostridia bacterium]
MSDTNNKCPAPVTFIDKVKNYFNSKLDTVIRFVKAAIRFVKNPAAFIRAEKKRRADIINDVYEPIVHNPENVLEVSGLKEYFPIKAGFFRRTVGYVKAVDGVTFNIKKGTTMGLVGESGCGKTTVGRTILRLYDKTGGQTLFNGDDINKLSRKELRALRPKLQIVFQDPYSSLSPRLPVGEIIGEAVREHKIVPKDEFDDYITKIMHACGLQEYHKDRYPHEFSGGQRQRICIARALALDPSFIVCDEPVSALDVSIQAQIINLLKDLQKEFGLTYLFISHDLSVVEHISNTVGVMYLGNIVEFANTRDLFDKPLHPYTVALFSAIPVPDPNLKMKRIILEGHMPSPANPPSGCKFHTRCQKRMDVCSQVAPRTIEAEEGHFVSCHLYDKEIMGDTVYTVNEKTE